MAFEASEGMYKTRVRHWGLDKKAEANEMSHALRIILSTNATLFTLVTVSGCSLSSPPSALVLVDASLPPPRTCLDVQVPCQTTPG
jgi:hypothetical protein